MPGWNFADVWEDHADRFGSATAQVQVAGHGHGERRFTWSELDQRADGIARELLGAGLGQQSKVAHYLTNCPEFLESMFGIFKAALVPVNTNYRYGDDELVYLWTNADVEAVVFHGTYAPNVERVRRRVPGVRLWLWVDDGSGPPPDGCVPYERAASARGERVRPAWGRSGDDLYLLYTGGTTGMPKGVMWRQDDIFVSLDAPSRRPLPDEPDLDALRAKVVKPGPAAVPAAPLMHGTGAFNAFNILQVAGSIVTLAGRSFDAVELLDTVEKEHIRSVSIVGDAFAKPILRALDAEPDRWDVSSLKVMVSSGVMWSAETKQGLLRHMPQLTMLDTLGSSEAIGMATATTTAGSGAETARFQLNAFTRVLDDDGRDVVPGSGQRGRVALRGRTPLGYYKDPDKSAATFVTVDGVRYSIPGDFAEVDADGTVKLIGRGSVCINTGGEKVYPEEVEEVLKQHPDVADAVVVGVPDERFGEAVTAMVEPAAGATLREADLIAHVKAHLSHFKAPKHVYGVDTIGRAPNGKVDYRRLKAQAVAHATGDEPGAP